MKVITKRCDWPTIVSRKYLTIAIVLIASNKKYKLKPYTKYISSNSSAWQCFRNQGNRISCTLNITPIWIARRIIIQPIKFKIYAALTAWKKMTLMYVLADTRSVRYNPLKMKVLRGKPVWRKTATFRCYLSSKAKTSVTFRWAFSGILS